MLVSIEPRYQMICLSCLPRSWSSPKILIRASLIIVEKMFKNQRSRMERVTCPLYSTKENKDRGWQMCCVIRLSVPVSVTVLNLSHLCRSNIFPDPLVCLCSITTLAVFLNIWFFTIYLIRGQCLTEMPKLNRHIETSWIGLWSGYLQKDSTICQALMIGCFIWWGCSSPQAIFHQLYPFLCLSSCNSHGCFMSFSIRLSNS